MSKVLVTKAKVDTIADKITALVDDTSKKTLDEMATSLNGVGLEVAEQEDLIAQIKSTVDSLPEAGGAAINGVEYDDSRSVLCVDSDVVL